MNLQDHVVVVFVSMHGRLGNNLEKSCQPGPSDKSAPVLHSNRIKIDLYRYHIEHNL